MDITQTEIARQDIRERADFASIHPVDRSFQYETDAREALALETAAEAEAKPLSWEVGTYGSAGFELQLPPLKPTGLTRSIPLKNLTLTEAKLVGAAPDLAAALEALLAAFQGLPYEIFPFQRHAAIMKASTAGTIALARAGRAAEPESLSRSRCLSKVDGQRCVLRAGHQGAHQPA